MTESLDNIAVFDEAVGRVMGTLYSQFPVPTILEVTSLTESQDRETLRIYASTIEFLASEGYLNSSGRSDTGGLFFQVVLTTSGLSLLRKTPNSLKSTESVGTYLTAALKSGAKASLAAGGRALLEAAQLPEHVKLLVDNVRDTLSS